MALLELFNFIHFIGLAFGLGGATIASVISAKAEKDKDVSSAFMKIMPSVSKLIMFGLILLIISGVAIAFLVTWPINQTNLIIKHVLVVLIVVIGIMINFKSKKMMKLTHRKDEKVYLNFVKMKKQIKILSIINLILWYGVTLLSAFV